MNTVNWASRTISVAVVTVGRGRISIGRISAPSTPSCSSSGGTVVGSSLSVTVAPSEESVSVGDSLIELNVIELFVKVTRIV